MLQRRALPLALLLSLVGACAKGSEVADILASRGTGTSGAGASSGKGGTGGGAAQGCGLQSASPSCNTCLDTSCCAEAQACADDPGCTICLGTTTPPASCNANPSLGTLSACLQGGCSQACAGGGGGGGSSGGAPGSCAGANDSIGCCDGTDTLWYCDASESLKSQVCSGGEVCGWDLENDYYGCVPPPAGEDPDGTYPIACGD